MKPTGKMNSLQTSVSLKIQPYTGGISRLMEFNSKLTMNAPFIPLPTQPTRIQANNECLALPSKWVTVYLAPPSRIGLW